MLKILDARDYNDYCNKSNNLSYFLGYIYSLCKFKKSYILSKFLIYCVILSFIGCPSLSRIVLTVSTEIVVLWSVWILTVESLHSYANRVSLPKVNVLFSIRNVRSCNGLNSKTSYARIPTQKFLNSWSYRTRWKMFFLHLLKKLNSNTFISKDG